MAAFKQWSSPRIPWWSRHRISWDNIWEALHIADKCLHKRKWRWKNHWERDEVSFVVWSNTTFSPLCNSLESERDHVSFIMLSHSLLRNRELGINNTIMPFNFLALSYLSYDLTWYLINGYIGHLYFLEN